MKLLLMMVTVITGFFFFAAEKIHCLLFNHMSRTGMILGTIMLPNKSVVSIASGYGVSKDISAVTNAKPGVATLDDGHEVVTSDILEITSGWARLTDRILRVANVSEDDISLEGTDTSDVISFPVGAGVGSVREISGWTPLSQILSAESSGGEQQFLQYQFLESDRQSQIPTVKNPVQIAFNIADDEAQAGYQLSLIANDDALPRAVRIVLPGGVVIYYNAYISATRTPTLAVNEIMAQTITLSLLSDPARY